jgi:large subunit ribosomal protein L21
MYAIVTTGGKQYRVEPGDILRVEKISAQPGDEVTLTPRLVVKDDGIVVNPSDLASARVIAEVTGAGRHKKVRVFKYKRRKNYHRTIGHRQAYTQLRIREIIA